MPVSFDQIPADGMTPAFYVEFDPSYAASGAGVMPWRTLLVGASEKPPTEPSIVQVVGLEDAIKRFGETSKSELSRMVRAFYRNASPASEVWCLAAVDSAKALETLKGSDDTQWKAIALGFDDVAGVTGFGAELRDRGGALKQADGVVIAATEGDAPTLVAYGKNFDNETLVVLPCPEDSASGVWASSLAGVLALHGSIDPARPFQTLPLRGVSAKSGFRREAREAILKAGVSTWTREVDGSVVLERLVTTYKKGPAYQDLNSVLTLSYLRWSFRTYFTTKYPRHKLADDDARFGPGQAVITPKLARAEAVSWYREMENLGLVEGGDVFKASLLVERDVRDRNRLNFLLPPNLINGFLIGAAKMAFAV
jgi:phage tail sheath gpL-like